MVDDVSTLEEVGHTYQEVTSPLQDIEENYTAFSTLLCGEKKSTSNDINEILNHLFESIKKICKEINKLKTMDDEHITLYGPFLGRSLLELGSTALIARLDPFRVLILREAQKQSDYDLGKPNSVSIKWQGDVLADDVNELWADKSLKSPTRALLGVYQRFFYAKFMNQVIDLLNDHGDGEWTIRLTGRSPEGLPSYILQEIKKLYSSLSKGIHHELVVPSESLLDRDTVVTLLNNTLHIMSTIGLITSIVPHVYNGPKNNVDLVNFFNHAELLEI